MDSQIIQVRSEVSTTSGKIGIDQNSMKQLLETGGIISCLLALSVFFWVLTQFVLAIRGKEEK